MSVRDLGLNVDDPMETLHDDPMKVTAAALSVIATEMVRCMCGHGHLEAEMGKTTDTCEHCTCKRYTSLFQGIAQQLFELKVFVGRATGQIGQPDGRIVDGPLAHPVDVLPGARGLHWREAVGARNVE